MFSFVVRPLLSVLLLFYVRPWLVDFLVPKKWSLVHGTYDIPGYFLFEPCTRDGSF